MGNRITKLRPVGGFCAETGGALSILLATTLGIPVSTTHAITGAIVGVGATTRLSRGAVGNRDADRLGVGADHSGGRGGGRAVLGRACTRSPAVSEGRRNRETGVTDRVVTFS